MRAEVKKIIEDYMNFGGMRDAKEFRTLINRVNDSMYDNKDNPEGYWKLHYLRDNLMKGFEQVLQFGEINVDIKSTDADLEDHYKKMMRRYGKGSHQPEKVKHHRAKDKSDLGKLVDEGTAPYPDRSDEYWRDRVKVAFAPEKSRLRRGLKIPAGYQYYDMIFLKEYYALRSITFGNWLSQGDRWNYIAAMGIGLFDLHNLLGFRPSQVSFGEKLSVAFGARGRGAAVAHFEGRDFVINITRYSRQGKKRAKAKGDKELNYLTASAGMGSFAHEYGHALDYYAGIFIRGKKDYLSRGRSQNLKPDKKLLKEDNAAGYMEKLLNKIIWKNEKTHSTYYKRLLAAKVKPYYTRRNELFARAFEAYVHYKMKKRKFFNIFLAETKYNPTFYLTPSEMKSLEKDFDQLINAIKWKIKTR